MLERVLLKPRLTSFSSSSIEVSTTSFVSTGLSVSLAPNTLYLISFGAWTQNAGDGLEIKLQKSGDIASQALSYSPASDTFRLVINDTHAIATAGDYVLRIEGSVKTSTATTLTLYAKKTTDLNDPTVFGSGVYLNARPI